MEPTLPHASSGPVRLLRAIDAELATESVAVDQAAQDGAAEFGGVGAGVGGYRAGLPQGGETVRDGPGGEAGDAGPAAGGRVGQGADGGLEFGGGAGAGGDDGRVVG